jgi:hypothetical protein
LETLGNTTTGKKGKRLSKFYILRTDNKPRNSYQDHVYELISVKMPSEIDGYTSENCRIKSFYSDGQKHEAKQDAGIIEFSSFEAVWEGAEAHFCVHEVISDCRDEKCRKLHGANNAIVTSKAKKFRADILKEGYTKFLENLVKLNSPNPNV